MSAEAGISPQDARPQLSTQDPLNYIRYTLLVEPLSALSTKRHLLNPVDKILGPAGFSQEFQVFDELTNGNHQLGSVDDANKGNAYSLPPRSFDQQILVLGEQDPAQSSRFGSSHRAVPSSCAVSTSTPRWRNPRVIGRGACTSMYSAMLTSG